MSATIEQLQQEQYFTLKKEIRIAGYSISTVTSNEALKYLHVALQRHSGY